ncbi:MAG TPA: hypothetical protein VGC41_11205 [Kofleriaceae bacterium]
MRPCLYVIALAACGNSDVGPTTQLQALAGEVAVETGASVIASDFAGNVLDEQVTDANGRVAVAQTDLVSVVFVRDDGTHVITTTQLASGTLYIHGPAANKAPIIAGGITVTGPAIAGPIDIDFGCRSVTTDALPASASIAATCFGTDSNIDVLITAGTSYFAARVPVADEVAILDIPAWLTETTPIAIDPAGATIAVTEIADTFPFAAPDDHSAWTGLVADQTRITATLDSRITTAYIPGVATAQTFTAADFLAPLTTTLSAGYAWTATNLGDTTVLHVASALTIWDAVLPTSADHIAFPLTATVTAPDTAAATATTLRAIDGPDTADFTDVQAAGLWNGSIVPPPTAGLLREADATL